MRTKALLLSAGVAAALVAAVFVGAAAANTGAPVFYDARYPAPATTGSEGYEVAEGTDAPPQSGGAVDEPDAGGSPVTTPDATPHPSTPPSPTPPGDAPKATPQPTPTPTPAPAPDLRAAADRAARSAGRTAAVADARRPCAERGASSRPGSRSSSSCASAWPMPDRSTSPGSGGIRPPTPSNRFPPMPADLTPEQYAAWKLALDGDAGTGADYRWQDAGCWGHAVHVTRRNELTEPTRPTRRTARRACVAPAAPSGGRDEFRDGAVQRSGIRSPEPDDGCRELVLESRERPHAEDHGGPASGFPGLQRPDRVDRRGAKPFASERIHDSLAALTAV